MAILISPLSRGIDAVLHKVAEHPLAALDKAGFQTAFNLGNLVVVLVADNTKRKKTANSCLLRFVSGKRDSHPRFA